MNRRGLPTVVVGGELGAMLNRPSGAPPRMEAHHRAPLRWIVAPHALAALTGERVGLLRHLVFISESCWVRRVAIRLLPKASVQAYVPNCRGTMHDCRTIRRGISFGDQVVGGLETAETRVVSSGPDHAEVWAPRSTNGHTHGVVAAPLGVPSQPVVPSLRVWALPAPAALRVSAGQRPGEGATTVKEQRAALGLATLIALRVRRLLEGLGLSPPFP